MITLIREINCNMTPSRHQLLVGYYTYGYLTCYNDRVMNPIKLTNKEGRCICRFQWQMLRSSEWILTHKNYYIGATPFPTFSTFQVTNQFSLFFSPCLLILFEFESTCHIISLSIIIMLLILLLIPSTLHCVINWHHALDWESRW